MPRITVLAGTNGAGKSSIAGARLREAGGVYFNPDEETRRILSANPGLELGEGNRLAWHESVSRLRLAIATKTDYAFETTLGGQTVTALLMEAADAGLELFVWYCGLDSAERHLARVQARVSKGGHDIPEEKIRQRYHGSRQNLVRLIPRVTVLRVYDNSVEADPANRLTPSPRLVLELARGDVTFPMTPAAMAATPAWAQPIVACAYQSRTAQPAIS
jgi:predicted ABC-type ATPase